ncbi:MAG: polyisoprenoid-binding protein [Nocardioidaceae bacterium]|nr:polyisoprenoid-binding protein [Nocardioidaceae bacterium]
MSQLDGPTAGTWVIDPTHTEIGFSVRHLMSKVRGKFEQFEGQLVIAENPLESRATATVQLSSITTSNPQRDDHLCSSDFFDVEANPVMMFETTGVAVNGDRITATGELTIKGVTKPIELEVDYLGTGGDPWGGTRVGLEAATTISRREYGIDFNIPLEGDKVMIGDKITVTLNVEAVLQSQDASNLTSA